MSTIEAVSEAIGQGVTSSVDSSMTPPTSLLTSNLHVDSVGEVFKKPGSSGKKIPAITSQKSLKIPEISYSRFSL